MLKQQTNKQKGKKKHHAMQEIKCLQRRRKKNSKHKTELKHANK